MKFVTRILVSFALVSAAAAARAEDGYELWLRYHRVEAKRDADIARAATALVAPDHRSPMLEAAAREVSRAITGLTGRAIARGPAVQPGAIIIGTPATSRLIASLGLPLKPLGNDGYLIRSLSVGGMPVTVIAARGETGALYGTFAWLRQVQTGGALDRLDIASVPKVQLRMLNHWDNLDRHVERGYAGQSVWDWWQLPDVRSRATPITPAPTPRSASMRRC